MAESSEDSDLDLKLLQKALETAGLSHLVSKFASEKVEQRVELYLWLQILWLYWPVLTKHSLALPLV